MSKIRFKSTIMYSAKRGDQGSIKMLFSSFIGEDETILGVEYFGRYGVFFHTHSFVCVTDKKLYAMEYGPYGKMILSDAFIEEINSGAIFQPSLFNLYFIGTILCLTIVGILLLNTWVRMYYKVNKSGMVWVIKEGSNIWAFANRSKMDLVNSFWRRVSFIRNQRKLSMK